MIRSFKIAEESTCGFNPKVWVEKSTSPLTSTANQSVLVEPLSTIKTMFITDLHALQGRLTCWNIRIRYRTKK